MKVSHKWLQTYFEKEIPSAEKLAELFTFHCFEVEGLETRGTDSVIDVKVLPDRAHYALSHKGIADEVAVLTKVSARNRYAEGLPGALNNKPAVKISNQEFCRRYAGRFAELPSGTPPSPLLLTQSLEAIGQRSISLIVDLANYVMFDIGQPMHAFDADKIKGNIVVRAAKEGEKIVLLDGKEAVLSSSDSVIADDEGPLAIAGVKGGKRAEVTASTERILLESANFDPTSVRRTSTRLDLRNESSKRFENEITPELAIHGMNNFCALLKELIPDVEFGPITDEYPVKPEQTMISIDPSYVSERLGVNVPEETMRDILIRMGIKIEALGSLEKRTVSAVSVAESTLSTAQEEVESAKEEAISAIDQGSVWKLTIPFDRLDLTIREDIVEEVGRIFGYEHIKGTLPPKTGERVPVLSTYYVAEKIRNILIEQGFSEVSLYTLVSKGDVETAYPLARDKAFARKNLSDGIMTCLEKNALNADLLGLDTIKIFEIGHVFLKEGEKVRLALGAAQIKKVKGLKSDAILSTYMEKLAKALEVEIKPSPKIDLKGTYAVCEIDLEALMNSGTPEKELSYADLNFQQASSNKYRKFSPYPFIVRDIAVFVPEGIQAEQVWQSIEKGIGDIDAAGLLVRHALFDAFKKDGKVSYAFRMVFQSMDKTLTDAEANAVMERIYAGMKANGWEVR